MGKRKNYSFGYQQFTSANTHTRIDPLFAFHRLAWEAAAAAMN
jgi:hypothetical protein